MNQKSFTRRDSATTFLRNLGFDKREYNDYILIAGGAFHINIQDDGEPISLQATKVPHHSDVVTLGISNVVSTPVKGKVAKVIKPAINTSELKGNDLRTVSGVCRQLVKDGKTNAEIWVIIKKEFKLTDNKKHYPAWYRAELNRKAK